MIPSRTRERFEYIDALRGFTMLLVIYAHLVGIVVRETDYSTGLFCGVIMHRIRMPLFFFVSGFFAYAVYDFALFKKRMKNRIFKQLYPTITVGLLYLLTIGCKDVGGVIMSSGKYGYWFTYCLFQTFVLFAVISLCMTVCGIKESVQKKIWWLVLILSSILDAYIKLRRPEVLETAPSLFLSYKKTIYLMPFFYFGVLCRAYHNRFMQIFDNYWFYIIICILWASSYYKMNPVLFRVSGYLGIIVLFGIFYYLRTFLSSDSKISERLRFIGCNTLPIYLFHNFFIYYLGKIENIKILTVLIDKPVIELIFFIVVSYLIAEVCLGIDKLLKNYLPRVHKYILGT